MIKKTSKIIFYVVLPLLVLLNTFSGIVSGFIASITCLPILFLSLSSYFFGSDGADCFLGGVPEYVSMFAFIVTNVLFPLIIAGNPFNKNISKMTHWGAYLLWIFSFLSFFLTIFRNFLDTTSSSMSVLYYVSFFGTSLLVLIVGILKIKNILTDKSELTRTTETKFPV